MSGPEDAAGRLVIERLDALYRLPAHHPQPAAARLRLDRLAEAEVAPRLAALLARTLDPADTAVWRIRRLSVDLTCDLAAVDDSTIARAWAGVVGAAVVRTLARGPNGEDVLRFPDRASFLARLLVDLAAGRAWNRWYYAEFDTLRSLPLAAALREALLREPDEIPGTLARLVEEGGLEAVLAALSDAGAERVAAVVGATGDPERDLVDDLAALWSEQPRGPGGTGRAWLRLAAMTAARRPELLARPGCATALERVSLLAGGLDATDARITGPQRLAPAAPGTLSAACFAADFAGVFFLLPSYLALDLETWLTAAQARLAGDPLPRTTLAVLRLLVLAGAFGRSRAAAAVTDPAVRLAAGLDEEPPAQACAALAGLPSLGAALATALPGHLADQRRIAGRTLAVEQMPARGADLLLVRDHETGHWLRLEPAPAGADGWQKQIATAIAGLRACDLPVEALLVESSEPPIPAAALAALPVSVSWPDPPDRRRPTERELEHLRLGELPDLAGLEPELERALALASHALLRHFAGRLMGFSAASAEHLVANFLSGAGQIAWRDGELRVLLPCMPLAVVARMAGAHGLRYVMPWLGSGGTAVELELPAG